MIGQSGESYVVCMRYKSGTGLHAFFFWWNVELGDQTG